MLVPKTEAHEEVTRAELQEEVPKAKSPEEVIYVPEAENKAEQQNEVLEASAAKSKVPEVSLFEVKINDLDSKSNVPEFSLLEAKVNDLDNKSNVPEVSPLEAKVNDVNSNVMAVMFPKGRILKQYGAEADVVEADVPGPTLTETNGSVLPRTKDFIPSVADTNTRESGTNAQVVIYLTDDEDDDEVEILHESSADKLLSTTLQIGRNGTVAPFAIPQEVPDGRIEGGEIFSLRGLAVTPSHCPLTALADEDQGKGTSIVLSADPVPETPRWSATTIGTFTVQCNLCGKWRIIPTKEQYEAIGERILQHPWVCDEGKAWREGASCRDPSDISEDEPSILWAVDKHNIPKPPPGFNRKVVLRGELSRNFADVYYKSPCGQTLRSMADVQRFLDGRPDMVSKGIKLSQFSFTRPKPGPGIQKRVFQSSAGSKKPKKPCLSSTPAIQFPAHYPPLFPIPLAVVDPMGGVPQLQAPEIFPPPGTILREQTPISSPSSTSQANGDSLYGGMSGVPCLPYPFGAPWLVCPIYPPNMSQLHHHFGSQQLLPLLSPPHPLPPFLSSSWGREAALPPVMPFCNSSTRLDSPPKQP